jgi:hypothetical protein
MTGIVDIYRRWPTQEACIAHLETVRWGEIWAIVKRAIYGQFHHISEKYLPLYLNELTWRYSERRNPDRFTGVLHLAVKPQTA